MFFVCHPKILHQHCLQFLSGVKMAPRETEDNAYAKFWGHKQRTLWYVMVFSGVVNRTEWSTIQGVIRQASNSKFQITSLITLNCSTQRPIDN